MQGGVDLFLRHSLKMVVWENTSRSSVSEILKPDEGSVNEIFCLMLCCAGSNDIISQLQELTVQLELIHTLLVSLMISYYKLLLCSSVIFKYTIRQV